MIENISASDIAVQGIRAQRVRMNVIANNIANAETTRTPGGGPFRRQLAIFRGENLNPNGVDTSKFGVKVLDVTDDQSPFRSVHDPSHPDADASGIVRYPNVNLAIEMIDLVSAQRAYDANVDVIMASKAMSQRALRIIEA